MDDGNKEYTISGSVVKETDLAWLINCEGDEVWMPKSTVKVTPDHVTLPKWLYTKLFPDDPLD